MTKKKKNSRPSIELSYANSGHEARIAINGAKALVLVAVVLELVWRWLMIA